MQPQSAPRVSVSIILKNACRTLPQLLASLEHFVPVGKIADGVTERRFVFDEIIFVDTGSDDATYEELLAWLKRDGAVAPDRLPLGLLPPDTGCVDLDITFLGTRFVFARYGWCDRFNAARNYSFSLSTADIRGYLDADDWIECDAQGSKARHLSGIFRGALRKNPHCAEFSFIYDYDVGVEQRHSRFFVWNRGYHWEGWIHEHCLAVPELDVLRDAEGNSLSRGIYKIHDSPGLVIHHDKTGPEGVASVERNHRIALAAYEAQKDPHSDIDLAEKARMAFHIAEYAKAHDDLPVATRFYEEMMKELAGTNYHAMSLQGLALLHLDQGNTTQALHYAGALNCTFPELLNGAGILLMAHVSSGEWNRAVSGYREARDRAIELNVRSHAEDTWITKGWFYVAACKALAKLDFVEEAATALSQVPAAVAHHGLVKEHYTEANVLLMQRIGFKKLKDLVDYYIWDCEASKALSLIDQAPMAIRRLPAVADMRAELVAKMHHLLGWKEYQAAYASIPSEDFDTVRASSMGLERLVRVQTLVEWGRSLDEAGDRVEVLSVGFHAGLIEQMLLETNDRIDITVVDVAAAQTSQGWKELNERFPGRVDLYVMQADHYDWTQREDFYDAAILFEVIEHVPDADDAVRQLHKVLKTDGKLFLSTPNSERWVEPYLTEAPPVGPSWYGHVRAFDYLELRDLLQRNGFSVDVLLEGHDNIFTTRSTKMDRVLFGPVGLPPQSIAIFLPGTPTPFDALSPDEGFLGGSEEAVVHLSKTLAKMGHHVEVFTPMPKRDTVRRVIDDVTWRPVNEFSPSGLMGGEQIHDAVLFWRCPGVLADPKVKAAKYKKLLWLHDANYSVPPFLYKLCDGILVLSEHHKACLKRLDGAAEDLPWRAFANGIDPEAFPLWDPEERDEKKVIYASSPDRGLLDLFAVWDDVKKEVPDATLDIYYDWTTIKRLKPELYSTLQQELERLHPKGVRYKGGVAQPVLHDAFRRAGVWAYPNTGDVETFCITSVKALATGCDPVANAAGALPEVLGLPCVPLTDAGDTDRALFTEGLVLALRSPPTEQERQDGRMEALSRFSWGATSGRLLDILMDLKTKKS